MPDFNDGFLGVPSRPGKPRDVGVTHVIDKGLNLRDIEGLFDTAGQFVDIVKFGWGTSYVTNNLEKKIALYRSFETPVVCGGTLFEAVYGRGRIDEFKAWLVEHRFSHVEISDGTIEIPRERKLELITDFARDFTVLSEVGSKDSDVVFAPYQWVEWINEELAAGAWKVITEGREGGTAGIFRADGDMRTGLLDEIAHGVPIENVLFEAPTKSSQAWFVKHFGPNVNLGNIPPDEVIPLETLRLGLRGDTLKEVLLATAPLPEDDPAPARLIAGPPWGADVDWKLSLAGLLIGLLVGVTGMGGGSLMTPLLVLFFGFKPSIAIGTDIVHGAIFKSFGAVQHRRLGHVHARLTAWMLLGSAPFSILGVTLAWWLRREYGDGYEDTAKAILGVALVVCGIAFLVKAYLHSSPEDKPFLLTNRDRAIAFSTGVVGGFVVGLTSVGSGTLFGLVMLIAFPLTAAKIVGTDIFHAAILLAVAGAGHLVAGHVDLAATGWLLIGSVPGVLIGGHFTVRLPDRALRIALAATLTLAGVRLVDPPGADVIVLTGAIAAAIAALAVGLRWLATRSVAPTPAPGEDPAR